MPKQAIITNSLFYGDNLGIMRRYIADASVDLIYVDPPFPIEPKPSELFKVEYDFVRNYAYPIATFEDVWRWDKETNATYKEIIGEADSNLAKAVEMLHGMLGESQAMAYLIMLAARLVEMRRVLKENGNIYVHCNALVSHHTQTIMDAIFGAENFIAEIIWEYQKDYYLMMNYKPQHDVILFYSKSESHRYKWNHMVVLPDQAMLEKQYPYSDPDGRRFRTESLIAVTGWESGEWHGINPGDKGKRWVRSIGKLEELEEKGYIYLPKTGSIPKLKVYLDDEPSGEIGEALSDVWSDISPITSKSSESIGYHGQKPMALLERIIEVSTEPRDVVFDPFCGGGPMLAAAQKLGRTWIGIDATFLATSFQRYLLELASPEVKYDFTGGPTDIEMAKKLAGDNPAQFLWWALSLVNARPSDKRMTTKEGSKKGDRIDGIIRFVDEDKGRTKQVILQVETRHPSVYDVRNLYNTLDKEGGAIGILILLEPPNSQMKQEAKAAGNYESPDGQHRYPAIQLVTIEQLLKGKAKLELPPTQDTFKEVLAGSQITKWEIGEKLI